METAGTRVCCFIKVCSISPLHGGWQESGMCPVCAFSLLLSALLCRETRCAPSHTASPSPSPSPSRSTPLRVPARREAATGCQAGAGLPPHGTGLRDRRLPPVGPAIPAGPGSTPRKTANEGGAGFAATDTPERASLQGKDGFSSFSHVGREIGFPGAV